MSPKHEYVLATGGILVALGIAVGCVLLAMEHPKTFAALLTVMTQIIVSAKPLSATVPKPTPLPSTNRATIVCRPMNRQERSQEGSGPFR